MKHNTSARSGLDGHSSTPEIASNLGIIARISSTASQRGKTPVKKGEILHVVGPENLPSLSPGEGRGGDSEAGRSHPTRAPEGHLVRLAKRYYLRREIGELLPDELVAACGRLPVPGREFVEVLYAPATQSAHYGGLRCCASVWHCPVCSSKVSERRRVELSEGCRVHRAAGGNLVLFTFTLSHLVDDDLRLVLGKLKKAYEAFRSGRWWVSFCKDYGYVGSVRSLEITNTANGWHPHFHVLFFFSSPVDIPALSSLVKSRWCDCVARAGGSASWDYGLDVMSSDNRIADYIAKFGHEPSEATLGWNESHEVTKGPSKLGRIDGRTGFQLAADYVAGDLESGELFRQYAYGLKGQRQIYWSKGLRQLLGLVELEQSDQEVAEEQTEDAGCLAELTLHQWKVIRANDAVLDVLQVARSGDRWQLHDFLVSLGVYHETKLQLKQNRTHPTHSPAKSGERVGAAPAPASAKNPSPS